MYPRGLNGGTADLELEATLDKNDRARRLAIQLNAYLMAVCQEIREKEAALAYLTAQVEALEKRRRQFSDPDTRLPRHLR